jgi:hypothetical protein
LFLFVKSAFPQSTIFPSTFSGPLYFARCRVYDTFLAFFGKSVWREIFWQLAAGFPEVVIERAFIP